MIVIKLNGEVEKTTNREFYNVSVSVCDDDDGKNDYKITKFESCVYAETEKALNAFITRYVRSGTKMKVITEINYIS